MYWDQLTSPQIAALDKNIPVIFPIAAIEQHGAHLPLATDRMINEHFCAELEKSNSKNILILPTVSVGCSEHHTEFAGSLSVQHTTFLNQLTDISNSVVKYGFKNLIILNSHGGNQYIAGTFMEVFGFRNPENTIVLATWWNIVADELKTLNESGKGGTGHAGEFETALMLLIAPHLVHLDQIKEKSNAPNFDWADGDMLYGSKAKIYKTMKQLTASSGVFGDASFGTKEKGEQITKLVVPALEKILLDLYES